MVVLSPSYPLHPFDLDVDGQPCTAGTSSTLFPSLRKTKPSSPSASGITMKHLSRNLRTTVASDRACAAERILTFLRARYPVKMAENVAADIGVSVATIRKLEERNSAPSLPVFWRMADAYELPFVRAVFGFAWLDEVAAAERQIELEAGIARQQAELATLREVRP